MGTASTVGLVGDSHLTDTSTRQVWKPLREFGENLRLLLLRASGGRVLLGPPPVSAASEATGRTNGLVKEYSAAAAAVAVDQRAAFISLVDLLHEEDLAEDGVHLNDRGYAEITEALVQVLRQRR